MAVTLTPSLGHIVVDKDVFAALKTLLDLHIVVVGQAGGDGDCVVAVFLRGIGGRLAGHGVGNIKIHGVLGLAVGLDEDNRGSLAVVQGDVLHALHGHHDAVIGLAGNEGGEAYSP